MHNVLQCLTVDICPNPGQPVNGNTIGSSFSVGDAVVHTCDDGFVLVGAVRRECEPDGDWSEPLPSCIGKFLYTNKCCITSLVVVSVQIANESFSVIEGDIVRRICVEKSGSAPVPFDVTITPVVTNPTEAACKSSLI